MSAGSRSVAGTIVAVSVLRALCKGCTHLSLGTEAEWSTALSEFELDVVSGASRAALRAGANPTLSAMVDKCNSLDKSMRQPVRGGCSVCAEASCSDIRSWQGSILKGSLLTTWASWSCDRHRQTWIVGKEEHDKLRKVFPEDREVCPSSEDVQRAMRAAQAYISKSSPRRGGGLSVGRGQPWDVVSGEILKGFHDLDRAVPAQPEKEVVS